MAYQTYPYGTPRLIPSLPPTEEGDVTKGAVEEFADYQTRMEKFDEVNASGPVVSLPVESSSSKRDLEL
ncbi:MAG: hypothetical protein LC749_22325 [Actinobacteria bacterium]|nr:hypothetical protein [Actinomycetota bacterium]